MKQSEWFEIAGTIADLWPDAKFPPATARAWYPLLCDLDAADVQQAVADLRGTAGVRFPPGPGDIRAAVRGYDADVDMARVVAALADGAANDAAVRERVRAFVPLAHETVRMLGGWKHLAALTEGSWQPRFHRAYQAAVRRALRDQTRAALDEAGGVAALTEGADHG